MLLCFRLRASRRQTGKQATPLCYPSSEQIGGMRANCVKLRCVAVLAALLCGGVPTRLCGQQSAPLAPSAAQAAPPVTEFRVVTSSGQVLRVAGDPISIEIGKPLDPAQVASSLKALYRLGNFSDIRAVSQQVACGVRIDFIVQENLFFNQVILQGLKPPPSEASAAAAMQITLGDVFRKETLDDGLERLRTRMQEEGFYHAKLDAQLLPHPAEHQMDIIVHVQPGVRARVGTVDLTNNTEYPDTEIISRLKMKPGTAITSSRIQNGTNRIRKFLVKKGHLSGRAAVRRGAYDSAKNTVDFTLDVSEGARVKVEVTGAKLSGGELKRLVPIYQEGAVDADLLEEGRRNIRERLEREGYFDSNVEYTTAVREVENKLWHGQEQVITYQIERGDRHKLVGIEVTGNHYFDRDLLFSRLQIYKAAFGSRGRFSRRLLESDRVSMEGLYRSNGFAAATVVAQVNDNYEKKEGDLFIRFVIDEGTQTRVGDLRIEGNQVFGREELLGVISSAPGQPYSEANVGSDRANILALYFNEGFPQATFEYIVEPLTVQPPSADAAPQSNLLQDKSAETREDKKVAPIQRDSVRIIYKISEGPQTRVRRVLLTGYDHTRLNVIQREVQVKPAQPLREGQVVDSQRRLYNLGVFNRVTISPQNPAGTDLEKDIVVLVEEAKRYTIAYGGGFEVQRLASTTNPTGGEIQGAPRGIFEISRLNLTGRADTLSLKLRGSTLQYRALLGYSAPGTFGNPKLTFQATTFVEKTQDINTFTETQYEGSVQLSDQLSHATTLLARYSFRKVVVSNLNIPPQEIPLFEQPTLVSQFGASWLRDTRDNPANASKGWLNSADFGIADTHIGSSASFIRFLYQNASYHPIKRRFSFARSVRVGILAPYGDTVSLTFPAPTTVPPPRVIPLPERLFAGGGTSLRGFALNQAGPRDSITGFPVGGQALLIFNQEFRFPMHLPWVGNKVGGTVFYDGGNTFSQINTVNLHWSTPKPIFDPANPKQCLYNCTNELNYFSHTIGVGARYATPVGPIRVDLGYQLNRPNFVIPIPCPSGTTPTTCPTGSLGFTSTRLPALQVFFSLGSSF
jgi:outer membrane protein insertion porin family